MKFIFDSLNIQGHIMNPLRLYIQDRKKLSNLSLIAKYAHAKKL